MNIYGHIHIDTPFNMNIEYDIIGIFYNLLNMNIKSQMDLFITKTNMKIQIRN